MMRIARMVLGTPFINTTLNNYNFVVAQQLVIMKEDDVLSRDENVRVMKMAQNQDSE